MEGAVCAGCGRTLDEIARWRTMSAEEKLAVLARLAREGSAKGATG